MLSGNGYINTQLFQDIRRTTFTGDTAVAMLRYRNSAGSDNKGSCRGDVEGSYLITTSADDIHDIKNPRLEVKGLLPHCQSASGDFIDTFTLHPQCCQTVSYTHLRAHETRHDLV